MSPRFNQPASFGIQALSSAKTEQYRTPTYNTATGREASHLKYGVLSPRSNLVERYRHNNASVDMRLWTITQPGLPGPTAEANRGPIEAIVERALEWERRSGATFEGDKTSLVHFTRDPRRTDTVPVMVKGKPVLPKSNAKILGLIIDPELRYKEHIAITATKGLNAAMALKRLRMTSHRPQDNYSERRWPQW
jgi:hypothetical protein